MEYLQYEHSDGIATVTLNRPKAYNALNRGLLRELESLLETIRSDVAVRAVIITGAGEKAFAAGADIKEFSDFSPSQAQQMAQQGQALFRTIETFPKPVVAAVNGFALGGGCELAMACHFRTASTTARFGQPEVALGLIPGYGGTQRLPRLIGRGRALEMLMRGHPIDAQTALRWGLVNYVFSPEKLMDQTRDIILDIIKHSRLPLEKIIRAVTAGENNLEQGMTAESVLFGECFATEDFREGVMAFLERRTPHFKGR